jgi:hypothetical protein
MQPLNAERLVRLDLPELELDPRQPRKVEIQRDSAGDWETMKISRFSADGRVFLVREGDDPSEHGEWLDLSTVRYRYLL